MQSLRIKIKVNSIQVEEGDGTYEKEMDFISEKNNNNNKIKTSSLKNANSCQAPILSDHDQTDQTKLTEATRSALVQFVIYLYPVWFAQKLKPQAD